MTGLMGIKWVSGVGKSPCRGDPRQSLLDRQRRVRNGTVTGDDNGVGGILEIWEALIGIVRRRRHDHVHGGQHRVSTGSDRHLLPTNQHQPPVAEFLDVFQFLRITSGKEVRGMIGQE